MNRAIPLLVFFIILCSTKTGAQTSQVWNSYFEDSSIKIEYTTQQCSALNNGIFASYYNIQVTNKTSSDISISWDLQAYYNEICKTCSNEEYHYITKVNANSTLTGNCNNFSTPSLTIFIEWINNGHIKHPEKLTKFELANIHIE